MEYHKIVVPLDGSRLAETVLPHVEKIAKGCNVPQVILITVTEPIRIKPITAEEFVEKEPEEYVPPMVYYGQYTVMGGVDPSGILYPKEITGLPATIGKMAKTGYRYLTKIADKLDKQGIPVSVALLIGNVAAQIVHFAEEQNADLIIMASRGRIGLRRWDVGNAALKVLQSTEIPIMLIRPPAGFKEAKPVRRGKAS
jgi:nucleotide-binding universal stress UspA family protein